MYKKLLLENGLTQVKAAEKIKTKGPYISMFISGKGKLPFEEWKKIYNFFLDLRFKHEY